LIVLKDRSLTKRSRKAPRVVSPPAVAEPVQIPETQGAASAAWTRRWPGWLTLWAGWLVPQLVLLGPALIGRTVDLPVDLLTTPHTYVPNPSEYAGVLRHGRELFDMVLLYPEAREFSAKELRAGRLPLWQPANFAGAPFAFWPKYSPFELLYYAAPYPVTLAWMAIVQAITVGLGMWLLLSRSFRLGYWPAALASWCAPMTGYVTVWHGSLPLGPVLWLPWSLWAVHSAVKNPAGLGGLWVALITGLMLLTGHPGVGGLVLLTTGLYFVWLLADDFFFGELPVRRQWRLAAWRVAVVAAGWLIGFLIGTPYLLPLLEYGRTGYRINVRSSGYEERPPEGLEGIPAILWPDVNGDETHATTTRITGRSSLIEGASAGYAGLLAALWLAPLAWRHRRLRSLTVFLALLTLVSLGWTLNVPGIIHLLRAGWMRPLASLSFNRWVFAAGDAILILAAIGLDSLLASVPEFRWRWRFPPLLCACFGCWCLYRFVTLSPAHTRQGFATVFLLGAAMALAGIAGWATTFSRRPRIGWLRIGLIGLLPLELFWFAWTERRQADISLNFPPIAVLDKLTTLPPGRTWGIASFEPNLNQTLGLEDIRGYDGVDPGNFISLFELAVDRKRTMFFFYARTQVAIPAAAYTDQGLRLHPVSDLLNVRYLIYRSRPPVSLPVVLHEDDYWIAENVRALPRAYVPRSVRVVRDDHEALTQMASYDFDPRQTAFVSDDLRLPPNMQGRASVQYPNPSRAEIDASMQTDGLVLVSDLWDGGWRAELDGAECPIYRVDIALRGFHVPAGKHRIVCTYEPLSVWAGFRAAAGGLLLLVLWAVWKRRTSIQNRFARFGRARAQNA
jgi:hypothetical protein